MNVEISCKKLSTGAAMIVYCVYSLTVQLYGLAYGLMRNSSSVQPLPKRGRR